MQTIASSSRVAHADPIRPALPYAARLLLGALGIALFTLLYLTAAHVQSTHQNTSRLAHDQSAVIHFAERLSKFHYDYVAPRNRMPLYPFLQSFVYRPGMDDDAFFQAGKQANVWLSLGLLCGVFAIFRSFLPLHASCNAVLVTAFGVFALKAPYMQAELLYYFFTLCFFLLMVKLLRRPSLLASLTLGGVLALAHLTKASTLPAILLFAVCYGIKIVRPNWFSPSSTAPTPLRRAARASYGLLAIVTFLALISPYLLNSKRIYGSYFYNVNSTFYMWCDSWTEAKHFSDMYDDRHMFPSVPADELPSPSNYLKHHSVEKIFGRLIHGFGRMLTETFRSFWYMTFLVIYAAAAAYAAAKSWPKAREIVRKDPVTPAFVFCFAAGYITLYAWWMILARSQRFVLTLFLPVLFALIYLCHLLGKNVTVQARGRTRPLLPILEWGVTALALLNLLPVLCWAAKAVNGGSTM